MPENVTLMEVYQIYQTYMGAFSFLTHFGGFGETLLKNFLAKVEAVGRAYCEENNLPFPLPEDKIPKNVSNPSELKQFVLGPKAAQAFGELKEVAGQIEIRTSGI